MTLHKLKHGLVIASLLGVLSGCASTPATNSETNSVGELNDKSFDLLFATEFPVDSEADALARGASSLNGGDVDKALFFYVRALQFNPENSELLAHIGGIQMTRNNTVMAKRAFLMAKKYDPDHVPALEGLGLIYMADGKTEQAVVELRAALAKNDRLWRTHNALGVYADKSGDFAAARRHYDASLSINSDASHVLNNRGYSKFLSGDVEGAIVDLYEAANGQGFRNAWANLGMVYAEQGLYDDALSTYQNVMSEAHAHNNIGQIALRNGDISKALHFLNEAIRLSPTYFPEAEENLKLLARLN